MTPNPFDFKTREQARAFLKRAGLLNTRRVIEGEEREKTLTMLRLMESEVSNNQHLWCETWKMGNLTYELVSGSGVDELIEITEHDI
jgi:hypothetical protein